MAVACCDAVRLACDELRVSAEINDTAVARAEGEVRANPEDEGAKDAAAEAYKQKCEELNKFLEKNVPVIEEKLQEARRAIKEDNTRLKDIEDRTTILREDKKVLKQELEEEKALHNAAKTDESTLLSQLNDATKASQQARKAASQYEEKGPFNYHPDMGGLYSKLVKGKLDVLMALESHRVTFAHRCTAPKPGGHGFDLQRLDQAEFEKLTEELQKWTEEEVPALTAELESLEATKAELIKSGWPEENADIYEASEVFAQVKKNADTWEGIVEEESRRRNDMKSTLEKFMKDDAKLLQWCRQERTNMEAQTEPHHVQEFCASLIQNIETMEENFAHLGDTGEALLPNKMVERALVEVNEVWLNLQINAYERQRHIMLEIHEKLKLENEVRAFSNFSTKLKKFLEETIRVLEIPDDIDSKQVVAPVLKQCRQLLSEFAPHALLSDHLSDFSLRMERIRDNYNVLRKTVFSKLTFLSTDRRTVDEVSSQRREEYVSKINEIKAWLKAHSDGESWESIHSKVMRIQQIIDRQLAPAEDEAVVEEEEPAAEAPKVEEEDFEEF
eukprot:Rhum_TRINITY_DN9333_c0_g1::Rhum_TRINITY_DN9333_c0_g1_i1::g.33036::m.33036